MYNFPVIDRIKIKKRGFKDWNCISINEAPVLFRTLEKVLSFEDICKMTDSGYIPF